MVAEGHVCHGFPDMRYLNENLICHAKNHFSMLWFYQKWLWNAGKYHKTVEKWWETQWNVQEMLINGHKGKQSKTVKKYWEMIAKLSEMIGKQREMVIK